MHITEETATSTHFESLAVKCSMYVLFWQFNLHFYVRHPVPVPNKQFATISLRFNKKVI